MSLGKKEKLGKEKKLQKIDIIVLKLQQIKQKIIIKMLFNGLVIMYIQVLQNVNNIQKHLIQQEKY